MPDPRLVRAFLVLWFATGIVVLVASVETLFAVLHKGLTGPSHIHLAALASVEAVAAALFLLPRTMRVGAIALLATFAVALAAHAVAGEFPITLVAYAAGVWFVLVHGGVSWRMAWPRHGHGAPTAD